MAEVIPVAKVEGPPRCASVLGDIVHQEGYVVISNVFSQPEGDGWWGDMIKDLNLLYKTNNNVIIFNGTDKSNDNHRFSKGLRLRSVCLYYYYPKP